VVRLLAALGAGFDCASLGEINQVLELGVEPSRIIFANPCKATSFVRAAARSNVDMMTFDNADELVKIVRVHPNAKLVIRILADDSKSLCRLGLKFGAQLSAVPALLKKARELKLDVIGVSFHVGSGCFDPEAFGDAVSRAKEVFTMAKAVGYRFHLLDVGGGFEDNTFERMAVVLKEAIDLHFPHRQADGIKVIAEPGRFFVSKAFTLATNIIARRAISGTEDNLDEDTPQIMCMSVLQLNALGVLTRHLQIISTTACMVHSTVSCLIIRQCIPTSSPCKAPSLLSRLSPASKL